MFKQNEGESFRKDRTKTIEIERGNHMAKQTRGVCKFCGKEYTRGGMLRHLPTCKARKKRMEQENGKPRCGWFELVISDKYDSSYWLIVEIRETATLKDLDAFIRDIWVECCGHLSAFEIQGIRYESCPDTDSFWGPPAKRMNDKVKNVLIVGDSINYEYDFGSTTELVIRVHDYYVGAQKSEKITLLSRNNPLQILCSQCGSNVAQWVDPEGVYEGNPFWCNECLDEADIGEDTFFLPVCNSPRMGVCGYEGSNRYPDQFVPDGSMDEEEKNFEDSGDFVPYEEGRKEATIIQWKELYETATRIQKLEPWKKFWDMDIIGIRNGAEEDTTFFSILGRGGDCYGIVVYEGYEGLNDFMMLTMQEQLNLPVDYVMFSQRNLTCYWGNRDELSNEQRKIIKELGYKYRGKNQWLYFLSFEPGYFPYNFNQDEVLRMTEYLQDLEVALEQYEKQKMSVDFEKGNMLSLEFEADKKTWELSAKPLPFMSFQFRNLIITDEELLADLSRAPKCKMILEIDVSIPGFRINDVEYGRPANPAMYMIADASSGMMLRCELQEPKEDAVASIAEEIVGFILQCGAPDEIRVSNILVEAGLEQICDVCGIKLRRVKRLKALDEFKKGMKDFL